MIKIRKKIIEEFYAIKQTDIHNTKNTKHKQLFVDNERIQPPQILHFSVFLYVCLCEIQMIFFCFSFTMWKEDVEHC